MLAAALTAAASASAQTHTMTDTDAIRHVIKSNWDKPAATVEVSPIVVVAEYAIAGWTQEANGGRALLRKKGGAWSIILCAGDQLRGAEALRRTGIADPAAKRLASELAQAESAVSRERIAMFSRFEGLVNMDGTDGNHAH